jgi:hypothetical protein
VPPVTAGLGTDEAGAYSQTMQTDEMFTVQKIDGTGSVHVAKPSRFAFTVITYCTGRALHEVMRPRDGGEVTCKACLARAKREGIDVAEVAAQ